ncbi:hypothetical protein T265_11134 [Opisthorchis viverrini]|uniref:Uncharacterized protein n=1 Tax=Opisthorchis viverrini TaxID=6198 RepID=A0A074ZYM3_OPIVI|nr:hypothetical protein T265_11134 [Opisthorchis viverrini]KER20269.1 hypothetical protein T265_11134 [Opisthorchis viverrini]
MIGVDEYPGKFKKSRSGKDTLVSRWQRPVSLRSYKKIHHVLYLLVRQSVVSAADPLQCPVPEKRLTEENTTATFRTSDNPMSSVLRLYMYRDILKIVANETPCGLVQRIQLPGNITGERFSWFPDDCLEKPN